MSGKVILAAAIVVVGLLFAYLVGRFTAPVQGTPQAEPAARYAEPSGRPLSPVPPSRPVLAIAPPVQPPPAPARAPGAAPETVTQVTEAAKTQLEALRPHIVSSCLPSSGLKGHGSAKLTFQLTFDAQGREIARGISEDRRARAGAEFTKCLRMLDGTALSVPPPGTNVAVSIPMTYP